MSALAPRAKITGCSRKFRVWMNGLQIGAVTTDLGAASAKANRAEAAARTGIRTCLCCTTPFLSHGPGNRLCDTCTKEFA